LTIVKLNRLHHNLLALATMHGSLTIASACHGILRMAGIAAVLIMLAGCDQSPFRNDLEALQDRGYLSVIMRNNGTCYYEGPHGPEGFEYDLIKAFADHLQVDVRPLVFDSEKEMLTTLLQGKADIIAANFIVKEDLRRFVAYGPTYQEIQMRVIGRRGGPQAKGVEDLIGQSIWIHSGAFQENRLNQLKKRYPDLTWLTISKYEPEELLEMVYKGLVPMTIADSNTIALNRRYYPELVDHFAIESGQKTAWVMKPQHVNLRDAVTHWFALPSTNALLQRLKQHYYGHLDDFDYVDIAVFRRRLLERLPQYRPFFEAAAKQYRMDWRLIAAQAYQESHWNPKAKSYTGVRGMMMLTRKTAAEMGISDRLDPEASIYGGTRYLAWLHDRLEDSVSEPDRTFMALAAYNVGWGHLQDARQLAVQLGRQPDSWSDIRATLPMLRYKKYYSQLRHGYARGAEPVRYVDHIRTYHKILLHWDPEEAKKQVDSPDFSVRVHN
jgi:membrane-bound lytic murein transglycosylase F